MQDGAQTNTTGQAASAADPAPAKIDAKPGASKAPAMVTDKPPPEPILKLIPDAIRRVNELQTFYRSEMIRVETVFSSLLLPASLTFVSALAFTHARQLFVSAQWALVAFFSAYLIILFVNLCALQRHEGKVWKLQDQLYKLPSSADSQTLSEHPTLETQYRSIESKAGSPLLTRPLTKIVLSLIAAGIAVAFSFNS